MIYSIIRTLSIIFCSLYIYVGLDSSVSLFSISKKQKTSLFCILITVSCLSCIFFASFTYFIPLLILWIITSYRTNNPQHCFIIVSVSFAISYVSYAVCSLFCTILASFLFSRNTESIYAFISYTSALLHLFVTYFLCKFRRFKNIFNTLSKNNTLNLSTFISIFLFLYTIYFSKNHSNTTARRIAFVIISIIFTFLINWWQAQITKAYRRTLELRELESLRTELQEKNVSMMKVMEENERIRHINHRDNGLITALDYAVTDYLVTDFEDVESAKARRDELLVELERIRTRRITSVNVDEIKAIRFETGISLLDILLNHTSKRANDEHVLLSVHLGTELKDFIPRIINDEDCAHLLSDLIENAFVATRCMSKAMIQIQFYKWNKSLVIEIADNGIPFEIDSLINMGITEMTTHADTGGSGIGLMDIWKIKEKYGATYHIEEYSTAAPFTKKISLTFDRKNRYSIRTYRKDEILAISKRADLQVYEQTE